MLQIVCTKGDREKKEKLFDEPLLENESEHMLMKALGGFLLVLSEEGDITYVSQNINGYLGFQQVRTFMIIWMIDILIATVLTSQIEILSQPIWEYTHQVSFIVDAT